MSLRHSQRYSQALLKAINRGSRTVCSVAIASHTNLHRHNHPGLLYNPTASSNLNNSAFRNHIGSKMTLVTITSNIAESLKKGAVVPDVLDKAPDGGLITVSYPDYKEVVLGNRLKVADTQSVPLVNITLTDDGQADASYTLVLTDPDAPTRGDEKWSEYCHWVVSGIKAGGSGAVTKVDLGKADELVKYMGPAPPESTGYHRYVFILYKEKSGSKPSAPPDRPTWGTNVPGSGAKEWAEKNGLTAVAVNYFIAQNDKQ